MHPAGKSRVELVLERLHRLPQKAAAFEYFEQLLLQGPVPGHQPLVGQPCRFVPEELVLAAGALPLRLNLDGRETEEAARLKTRLEAFLEMLGSYQSSTGASS
jgi:benzoyl-CoA reductase/2-hydroxyglutaryl-CoA dehydratase subunit BcrC/BadD/HgdB